MKTIVALALALAACGTPNDPPDAGDALIAELSQELDATRTDLVAMTADRNYQKATAEECFRDNYDACREGAISACGVGSCPAACR